MNKPNPNMYATDYETCSLCGVRQKRSKLKQERSAPTLKPGRAGALVRKGPDFVRGPDTAPEVLSDAHAAELAAQPWFCRDASACALNRVAGAVAKYAAKIVDTEWATKIEIEKELREFEASGPSMLGLAKARAAERKRRKWK